MNERDKYADITYNLAPCRSCKSDRVILLRSGPPNKYSVDCLGFPQDPIGPGKRIKCDKQTGSYHQWTDAVNEWNRNNRPQLYVSERADHE